MKIIPHYPSWGFRPPSQPASVRQIYWRDEIAAQMAAGDMPVLAYGRGRSYGDVCLNNGGALLPTSCLNRILSFDAEQGVMTAECGVTFGEIMRHVLPRGWCLPVVPGTQYITLGGAIANDVHGKNHLSQGTFGRHVLALELWHSQEGKLTCGPEQNAEFFRATIGGLGLTGFITQATFRLLRVEGPKLETKTYRDADCVREMLRSDSRYPYSVAWLDGSAPKNGLGRGIVSRARFVVGNLSPPRVALAVPAFAPSGLISRVTVSVLNHARWLRAPRGTKHDHVSAENYFYPLDQLRNWNLLYGKRGFYQHQCVIPRAAGVEPIRELLRAVRSGKAASFVTVLKAFGNLESSGLLSFPSEGLTLSLDLSNTGRPVLDLLDRLDQIVLAAKGRIYPAKDARMSASTFRVGYPAWETFGQWIDPAFSSSFWRRMTEDS